MSVSVGASTKVRAIEQGNSQSNSRIVMFLHDRIGFGLFVESSSFRAPESYLSNSFDVPLEDEMLRTIKANDRAHVRSDHSAMGGDHFF